MLFRGCCGQPASQRPTTPIVLYHAELSAPCRAVRMTMRHLNLPVELKTLDLAAGEHLKPDYIKMNPQHTVPTIVDEGFVLFESRAIVTYLVDKYAPGDDLYPCDLQKRAIVNRLLYFDASTLYPAACEYFITRAGLREDAELDLPRSSMRQQEHRHLHEVKQRVKATLEFVYVFLDGRLFLTGNEPTVADLSVLATLSVLEAASYPTEEYPAVKDYSDKLKARLPYYAEVNSEGMRDFRALASL